MKKLIPFLLLALSTLSFAGEGDTMVVNWLKSSTQYTQIDLTNISDETVTVFITYYNYDGTVYNEASETGTQCSVGYSFSGDPLTTGATLDPDETGTIQISAVGAVKKGYAIIKWETTGSSRVALVGAVRHDNTGTSLRGMYLLNDGQPF